MVNIPNYKKIRVKLYLAFFLNKDKRKKKNISEAELFWLDKFTNSI